MAAEESLCWGGYTQSDASYASRVVFVCCSSACVSAPPTSWYGCHCPVAADLTAAPASRRSFSCSSMFRPRLCGVPGLQHMPARSAAALAGLPVTPGDRPALPEYNQHAQTDKRPCLPMASSCQCLRVPHASLLQSRCEQVLADVWPVWVSSKRQSFLSCKTWPAPAGQSRPWPAGRW